MAEAKVRLIAETVGEDRLRAFSNELKKISSAASNDNAFKSLASSAAQLRNQIDPMYAAQQRYNEALKTADVLQRAGLITVRERAAAEQLATQKIEAHIAALKGEAAAQNMSMRGDGQRRSSMIMLGQQMGDVGIQLQMGTSLARTFAMQAGQIGYALDGMGGKLGKVGAFLAGPWGAALTIAVSTLGMMAEELFATETAAKKVELATYGMSEAQGILGGVMDLLTGKINVQTDALLAHARAQAIDMGVKARSDMATAKGEMRGIAAPGFNIEGGMGGGIKLNTGVKRVEGGIIEAYQEGTLNAQEAIRGLESLGKTGMITDAAMMRAIQAVDKSAMAQENSRISGDLLKSLDGDQAATRQFLRPGKTARQRKAPTQEDLADAYATALNAATQDELKARRALTNSINDRYQAELESIASDMDQKKKDLANNTKLDAVEKLSITTILARTELQRKELAERKRTLDLSTAITEAVQADLRAQSAEKNAMLQLATTRKDRLAIQLDLLRIETEQRRVALNKIVSAPDGLVSDIDRANAGVELNNLDPLAQLRAQAIKEQNASPIQQYADSMVDSATQVEQAWVNALKNTENALVEFAMTGKLSFKDMANSIISDIVRIAIQQAIMKPLTGFLQGILPSALGNAFDGGGVKKFAAGGIVSGATPFAYRGGLGVMGEAGPEAIMPLKRGANGRLGVEMSGGGGGSVVVNVNVEGGNSQVKGDPGKAAQLGNLIANVVRSELVVQKRPGGLLSAA